MNATTITTAQHEAMKARADDLAARLDAAGERATLLDIFTADEYTAAIARALQDGDIQHAVYTLREMTKRHPQEAAQVLQAIELGVAMNQADTEQPPA